MAGRYFEAKNKANLYKRLKRSDNKVTIDLAGKTLQKKARKGYRMYYVLIDKVKPKRVKSRTLSKSTRQVGKSNLKIDKRIKAKAPGKRMSKSGNIYYEYRKNRSDVKGRDSPPKSSRKALRRSESTKIKNANKLLAERKKAYEAKRKARIAKLERLAMKSKSASNSAYKRSNELASVIPMGQPILVGHHSEKSHRSRLKKIRSAMDASITESNKAEEYERRLAAAKSNAAISSDDPDAVKKLQKKLSLLEKKREAIKLYNKNARKAKKEPHPKWVLQNLGQNINSVKKRIEFLKKQSKAKPSSKVVKGVKVVENVVLNRLQLEFPDKPNVEIRTLLKKWGFRWSPREGRWQRQLTNSARYAANQVLSSL